MLTADSAHILPAAQHSTPFDETETIQDQATYFASDPEKSSFDE